MLSKLLRAADVEARVSCRACGADEFYVLSQAVGLVSQAAGVKLVPTRLEVACADCKSSYTIRVDRALDALPEPGVAKPYRASMEMQSKSLERDREREDEKAARRIFPTGPDEALRLTKEDRRYQMSE